MFEVAPLKSEAEEIGMPSAKSSTMFDNVMCVMDYLLYAYRCQKLYTLERVGNDGL